MKLRPPFRFLVFSLLTTSCFAAEPATTPSRAPGATQQSAINVDFRGGTIADLVATVSSTGQNYFNVIGEQTDLATPLPPFSLRNADPGALAGALSQLLQPRGLAVVSSGGNPTTAVYALMRFQSPSRTEPSTFYSAQLTPYLQQQTIDDIIGAIRMAWELDPGNDRKALQLKFHPPTSILLVAGPQRGIETALKVLSALKRTADDDRGIKTMQKPTGVPTAADKK